MVFRKSRRKIELKEDMIIDNVKIDFVKSLHKANWKFSYSPCQISKGKNITMHWCKDK